MAGHALVVGGTGMLRGVCLSLAARGWTVSVVARGHGALASLRERGAALAGPSGAINPLSVDYHDIAALALAVRNASAMHGPFTLAVCYIHSSAPVAPILLADVLSRRADPCPYVHVVGSAAPDELRIDATRDEISQMPGIRYRRVILGFVMEKPGSRWLSDDEICDGVLCAIDDPAPEQVVGVLSPWDQHPA